MSSLVIQAKAKGLFLATAESLTGGLLADAIVREAGASEIFLGGVIAYQDEVKSQLLGVSSQLLQAKTAVDAEVAIQMAQGARESLSKASQLDAEAVIGISTTGVAGPSAPTGHLVGEVFIGISSAKDSYAIHFQFEGDRSAVRESSVRAAIGLLWEEIGKF